MRKLTMSQIRKFPPGDFHLGANIVVQTTPRTGKNAGKGNTQSWLFMYEKDGKRRYIGLGSLKRVTSIKAAEELAAPYQAMLADKLNPRDPFTEKRKAQAAAKAEAAKAQAESARAMTFVKCAHAYMSAHASEWEGDPYIWAQTLDDYAFPIIGNLDVRLIETPHIMKVLEQQTGKDAQSFWHAKGTTASRVRQRIEAILDWARTRCFREGENPARWKGHLEHLLSAPKAKVKRPALPYALAPALAAELARRDTMLSITALFYMRTVTRTWDPLVATIADVDRKARLWTVNDPKRKGDQKGLPHIVPLSDQALADIDRAAAMATDNPEGLLFPQGNKLTAQARLNDLLKEAARAIGYTGPITAHGMRSCFTDWAGDETEVDKETRDFVLGHVTTGSYEAYRRTTSVKKRAALMQRWADYLDGIAVENVVAIGRRK
jgi:integrase